MGFTGERQRSGAARCAALVIVVLVCAGCGAADPTAEPSGTASSPAASPTVPDPAPTTPAPDPAQTAPAPPVETTAPTAAATEEASEDASGWRWSLIAVGALVVLGLAYLLWRVRSSRARWDARFTQCCDRLRWVDDSLVPQVLAARSAAEAAAMWNGARTRVTAVDEELSALAGAPPTHARRDRAAALQQALGDLTTAVDADTAIAHTGDPGYLRASRTRIEQARARLSAELNRIMVS
ncbi:MAG: hypothetical protein ABWZ26_05430 [Candidatus Nanopelagicales bacterium]